MKKNVARVLVWDINNHRAPQWIKDFDNFDDAGEYMLKMNREGWDAELGSLI